ncbi:MAG: AAA family ATPase [Spirulinaceae cyanobacterium]
MYISKIRVHNYKAFDDSGWIKFKQGINIISGQNNSGKTALLEALSLNFQNLQHRSLKTLPTASSEVTELSEIEVSVLINQEEIEKLISENHDEIRLPASSDDFTQEVLHRIEDILFSEKTEIQLFYTPAIPEYLKSDLKNNKFLNSFAFNLYETEPVPCSEYK